MRCANLRRKNALSPKSSFVVLLSGTRFVTRGLRVSRRRMRINVPDGQPITQSSTWRIGFCSRRLSGQRPRQRLEVVPSASHGVAHCPKEPENHSDDENNHTDCPNNGTPVTNPMRRRIKPRIIMKPPVLSTVFAPLTTADSTVSEHLDSCEEFTNYLRRAVSLALSTAFRVFRSALSTDPSTLLLTRPTFSLAPPARRSIFPSDSNFLLPVRPPTVSFALPFTFSIFPATTHHLSWSR